MCLVALAWRILSADASAQGLTGGLKGLREAYFLAWGFVGVIPALLLIAAFVRRRARPSGALAGWLALPSVLYAPTAISLVFVPSHDIAAKAPALMGFGLLIGATVFYAKGHPALRRSLIGILGVSATVLVAIPNSYWEVPFARFERVEYVDNVAPDAVVATLRSRSAPRSWLALEDGRHLIQETIPRKPDGARGTRVPYGRFVVLEPVDLQDPGRWYSITHYDWTSEYVSTLRSSPARFVIPLSTRSPPLYRRMGSSRGVLLDGTVDVDYGQMLNEVLGTRTGSWSSDPDSGDAANVAHWATVLAELAGIPVDSPEFLDTVFQRRDDYYGFRFLVDLGVRPGTQDSGGNTMLHVAARNGDVHSLRWLLEIGADPRAPNDRGRTALEEARARYEASPTPAQRSALGRTEAVLEPLSVPRGF